MRDPGAGSGAWAGIAHGEQLRKVVIAHRCLPGALQPGGERRIALFGNTVSIVQIVDELAFTIGGLVVHWFETINGLAAVGLRGGDDFRIAVQRIGNMMVLVVGVDNILEAFKVVGGAGRRIGGAGSETPKGCERSHDLRQRAFRRGNMVS